MLKKLIDWIMQEDDSDTRVALRDDDGKAHANLRVRYDAFDEPYVKYRGSYAMFEHRLLPYGVSMRRGYNWQGKWKHTSGPEVRLPNAN